MASYFPSSLLYMLIAAFAILFPAASHAQSQKDAPYFSDGYYCLRDKTRALTLRLQIAKTPEQLAYGLMYRKKLAPYDGMIFLFESPRIVQMWMKDTPLPLDMLFIDNAGKIVEIARNAVPYSETIIATHQPVSSVIELEAGRAKKLSATRDTILGAILSDGACKPF